MQNVLYFILLAVGVLITTLVITVTISIGQDQVNRAQRAAEGISQILGYEESEFNEDLKGPLTGTTVRDLLVKYSDAGFYTLTTTKNAKDGFYACEDVEITTSDHFIKDDAIFHGELIRGNNDVIIGVKFTEAGLKAAPFDLNKAADNTETTEQKLTKAQYALFQKVKENSELCKDCIRAAKDYEKSINKFNEANSELDYRKIVGQKLNGANLAAINAQLGSRVDFYTILGNTLDRWTKNSWYNALIYNAYVYDSDDDSAIDPDDTGGSYDFNNQDTEVKLNDDNKAALGNKSESLIGSDADGNGTTTDTTSGVAGDNKVEGGTESGENDDNEDEGEPPESTSDPGSVPIQPPS